MQYLNAAYSVGDISEDCLTLNVIRPTGNHTNLPVLVWIFGGGLYAGSTYDPQYNLSGIVKVSQDMGQPIIAVDLNYRLGMWGFLQTPGLVAEGSSNAGLMDQRLALHWIQENIASFGGDPSRVVVWGESAGAQSIGYHLLGYDGRNDGLFRGAIMESGGPKGTYSYQLSIGWTPHALVTARKPLLKCRHTSKAFKCKTCHSMRLRLKISHGLLGAGQHLDGRHQPSSPVFAALTEPPFSQRHQVRYGTR